MAVAMVRSVEFQASIDDQESIDQGSMLLGGFPIEHSTDMSVADMLLADVRAILHVYVPRTAPFLQ